MLLYQIALTLIPGIGDITAKKLIAYCGSAQNVFHEKRESLKRIPGIGDFLASSLLRNTIMEQAENEIRFIDRNGISALYFEDAAYPDRLRQCTDGPVILYVKGPINLNVPVALAMVGTRKATTYGYRACTELVQGLVDVRPLIISGLAYGIDTISHRAALDAGLKTVGVLAHGLDRIYPPPNAGLARKMLEEGGLVTDFPSGSTPDRENFPKRNRIIAGLADAVIVVEAAKGGGALITADIANSYNRDVFAVPGRWSDALSEGCNHLIRTNRGALIQSAADVKYFMDWERKTPKKKQVPNELLLNLDTDETMIIAILQERGECSLDALATLSGLSLMSTAKVLLQMELRAIVRSIPGNRYTI